MPTTRKEKRNQHGDIEVGENRKIQKKKGAPKKIKVTGSSCDSKMNETGNKVEEKETYPRQNVTSGRAGSKMAI